MMSQEVKNFILENVVSRFLRYVQIWTTSDVNSKTFPSTKNQYELAKILVKELEELNLENILLDDKCYVYADLPASEGLENVKPIGLIAHIDTSEMVSGKNVKPIIHKNYDGKPIQFSYKQDLLLTIDDSSELEKYIGFDIITASGDTLLGADDKAGIAEILTACAVWKNYPQFKHGPITLCYS